MALPEGFKKIGDWSWMASRKEIMRSDNTTVCAIGYSGFDDSRAEATESLFLNAPDHALLLAGISAGTCRIFIFDGFVSIKVWASAEDAQVKPWSGQRFDATLDSFGCPVLTPELRAALIAALEETT